jgi:hypothetical protein
MADEMHPLRAGLQQLLLLLGAVKGLPAPAEQSCCACSLLLLLCPACVWQALLNLHPHPLHFPNCECRCRLS